jgi:hypothetical protein
MQNSVVLIAALCLVASGQEPQAKETRGIPPRATPADYQCHARVGTYTLAAEFVGHAIPTIDGTLNSEEFVVVEAALFGPPGARLTLSFEDFSLRINDKKSPTPSEQYGLVFASLKDPELEPSKAQQNKSKTSFGGGQETDSTPVPVKIPIEVRHAMQLKVQKSALPGGDRALPQDGLLFFRYRGKSEGIHNVELVYNGPAGKVTLPLQP